jgi:hypothetical protein
LDRWIVALQAVYPFDILRAQAQRAGQGGLDEDIRVLGSKTGDVGEGGHQPTIALVVAPGNRREGTTPRLGGRALPAISSWIGS